MITNYIGADVDCKMTELAVERNRQIVTRDRVPTDIRSIRNFLGSIPGRKEMVIEEGPMAGWLYRNLRVDVDKLVVCDPRRNKLIGSDGEKTDPMDAQNLAILLRGGYLREVYHSQDQQRVAFKETVALYYDRVKDAVRQTNKLRSCCRSYGICMPARALKDPLFRRDWVDQLGLVSLCKQLNILWTGFDTTSKQVRMAKTELARQAKAYPIISYWKEMPGIGLIRAATVFAYLDTPWRFKTSKKLWKYCGVGLRRFASGSDNQGRLKPGNVRLFRHVNRKLKAAILGAAVSAIGISDNPFRTHYQRMLSNGVTESNARHTVARKMLTVMWGMWKTNRRYKQSLV
jgi:transposase